MTPGVSITEAAKLLGVSPGSVRRRVQTGDIPAYRVGARVLIDTAELEAYRRRNAVAVVVSKPATVAGDDWRKRWAEQMAM